MCLFSRSSNPLKAELNPIYHLLALVEAHHILHVSRVRVNNWCTFSKSESLWGSCFPDLYPQLLVPNSHIRVVSRPRKFSRIPRKTYVPISLLLSSIVKGEDTHTHTHTITNVKVFNHNVV